MIKIAFLCLMIVPLLGILLRYYFYFIFNHFFWFGLIYIGNTILKVDICNHLLMKNFPKFFSCNFQYCQLIMAQLIYRKVFQSLAATFVSMLVQDKIHFTFKVQKFHTMVFGIFDLVLKIRKEISNYKMLF